MEKDKIKQLLRETFASNLDEAEKEGEKTQKKNKTFEKDYQEVQRKLDGTILKMSSVMQAAGLGSKDDATARSLFRKKVFREKNDEGGTYQFNDDELASVVKVINNPSAYLGKKQ